MSLPFPRQVVDSGTEDLNDDVSLRVSSDSKQSKRGLSRQNAIYFDSNSNFMFLPDSPQTTQVDSGTEDLNNATLLLNNTKQSKHGLSRQNAIIFDSDFKFHDVEDRFDIKTILLKLDAKYPHIDFFQYEEMLQKLKVHYLETANFFEPQFYQSRGMSDEAAELFRMGVSKEYSKALLEHERGKMKRRLGGEHTTVPVFFSYPSN